MWIHYLNRLAAACKSKYMLFENLIYCFLNHSHELITLNTGMPACICRPIARRRASWLSYILVLRISLSLVNLPGLTDPNLVCLYSVPPDVESVRAVQGATVSSCLMAAAAVAAEI